MSMIFGDPILISGGGGIPCILTIETSPGATVTATFENKTVVDVADDTGIATLILEEEGVWTVTADDGNDIISMTIDTTLERNETISMNIGTLEETDWATISMVSKSGVASRFWKVGDTKTFVMGSQLYTAQIVSFDHYEVTNSTEYGRSKAGIAFQFKETPNKTYVVCSVDDSTGGYADMPLSETIEDFIYDLDTDLQDSIVNVFIPYADTFGSTTVYNMRAKLFLPSEYEMFGVKTYDAAIVGSQYDFYKSGNSRIKYAIGTSTAVNYWTRSLYKEFTGSFCTVNADGTPGAYSCRSGLYIAPVFCV